MFLQASAYEYVTIVGGCTAAILWNIAFRICLIHLVDFLCNCLWAFLCTLCLSGSSVLLYEHDRSLEEIPLTAINRLSVKWKSYIYIYIYISALSAGAVEYADCIFVEEQDTPTNLI